jgi:hypothetical protein
VWLTAVRPNFKNFKISIEPNFVVRILTALFHFPSSNRERIILHISNYGYHISKFGFFFKRGVILHLMLFKNFDILKIWVFQKFGYFKNFGISKILVFQKVWYFKNLGKLKICTYCLCVVRKFCQCSCWSIRKCSRGKCRCIDLRSGMGFLQDRHRVR